MKRLMAISIVICLSSVAVFAMRYMEGVTKDTQEQQDLDFTLSALRATNGEVQVKLEVPHTGKLEHFLRVELWIMSEDPRRPALVASLKPYHRDDSVTRVFFRLQSDLAEKAQLYLVRKSEEDPTGYSMELKSYIRDRKSTEAKHP